MKSFIMPLVFIHLLGKAASCEQEGACHRSNMKMFLHYASSFLQKAQDLHEGVQDKPELCPSKPMDCAEILRCGYNKTGTYDVWPRSRISENKIQVFCDMTTEGGGWTVFQRRGDYGRDKEYFYNDWNTYKSGFGKVTEDFWLGNDNIYALTNQRLQSLRIDMKDLENNSRCAVYDNFWIDEENRNYTLHVRGYTGDAGDSFGRHTGYQFSTKDRDNDIYEGNCAVSFGGGWWYGKCHSANLNGLYLNGTHESYANGINWVTWKYYNYSLPFVEMKIRPFTFSASDIKSVCLPTKIN